VIEKFSNGESKVIVKNGDVRFVSLKDSKIGLIYTD